jgi:rhodanese-related sulfurtransferase
MMRFALVVLAAVAGVAPLRAQDPDLSSPKLRIAYDEFKSLYDAHRVVVIDTRDEASFDMGHIPGARVIPLGEIDQHVAELKREKKPIVTYCS